MTEDNIVYLKENIAARITAVHIQRYELATRYHKVRDEAYEILDIQRSLEIELKYLRQLLDRVGPKDDGI